VFEHPQRPLDRSKSLVSYNYCRSAEYFSDFRHTLTRNFAAGDKLRDSFVQYAMVSNKTNPTGVSRGPKNLGMPRFQPLGMGRG